MNRHVSQHGITQKNRRRGHRDMETEACPAYRSGRQGGDEHGTWGQSREDPRGGRGKLSSQVLTHAHHEDFIKFRKAQIRNIGHS